jgi:hypothetical protein
MITFADRTITVTNISYVVGDSAFGGWYNAGEFGNNNLDNADVNNAFLASLGLFTPYPFSDVFDAMDAFPEDSSAAVGGDGQIRFLDWNVISERSLRLSGNNWRRSWSAGGARAAVGTALRSSPSLPAESLTSTDKVWSRDGSISAATVENVGPGQTVTVPVYAKLANGKQVKGLQFRAVVEADGGTPALTQRVQFSAAANLPAPVSLQAVESRLPLNQTVGAWSIVQNAFVTPVQGETLLGNVTFAVPANAAPGQSYTVRFLNVDGAPDLSTQLDLESLPGTVWVGSKAQRAAEVLSDEYKQTFFGSLHNRLAAPDADPDGDGVTNLEEYKAGKRPTKLRLHDLRPEWQKSLAEKKGFKLRWFAEDGRKYVVERSADLGQWSPVASNVAGAGDVQEVTDSQAAASTFFYRVRVQP